MPARAGAIPKTAGGDGKRPVGRPSKLTPELSEKICSTIRIGNYVEVAAAFCSISKETVFAWLRQGAAPGARKKYREFSVAVGRAMAESETRHVATITAASRAQWQAAAWHLERSHPKRWGRNVLEIQGPDGGPVQIEAAVKLSRLTDQELDALCALVDRAANDKK